VLSFFQSFFDFGLPLTLGFACLLTIKIGLGIWLQAQAARSIMSHKDMMARQGGAPKEKDTPSVTPKPTAEQSSQEAPAASTETGGEAAPSTDDPFDDSASVDSAAGTADRETLRLGIAQESLVARLTHTLRYDLQRGRMPL
jgi:hypothetical protein